MRAASPQGQTSSRLATHLLLLAGFCGFFFFIGLSYFGLIGADEPRYAQVAREMLARHDWVTPTLGGKPWLEKPPLYYWQAMVAFRIFGVSDGAARLPSAFDATLMVFVVYLFLRRFRAGFHFDGAVIVASSAALVGFARAASTDMPLAATFTIAMLAWYAWYESRNKSYLAISYLFLGLGMLAKGPVAILLAVLVITLFALARSQNQFLAETLWLPGIAIFLAVSLPWYIAVQIKNPDFFKIFILQHNLARFGTGLYHHPEPFWYYLPITLLSLLPWTVFTVIAGYENIRAWRRGAESTDSLSIYLLVWLVVPLAFFSLSKSKLPGYILPAVPSGTLLVAEHIRLQSVNRESPSWWQIVIHALGASAILVPGLMAHYLLLQHPIPWNRLATPLIAALACATAIIFMVRLSGLRMLRLATLIPLVLVVGMVLRTGSPLIDASLSARLIANEIAHHQAKSGSTKIAVFEAPRETEYGLAFYLNHPIPRYERSEIPASAHFLISPAGSQVVVERAVPSRRVTFLGTFERQRLDYFWIDQLKPDH